VSVIDQKLSERSGSKCELCGSTEYLRIHLTKEESISLDNSVLVCSTCKSQIENTTTTDPNHWRCLSESMWNENKPVQVVAWRMLNRLRAEGWPQDLLDMMYLDEETLVWAGATGEGEDVKGANFTAKRGAAVHNIKLVWDNADQIEGRVEGQHIVILTQYVKKTK
jgi:protein PhnA